MDNQLCEGCGRPTTGTRCDDCEAIQQRRREKNRNLPAWKKRLQGEAVKNRRGVGRGWVRRQGDPLTPCPTALEGWALLTRQTHWKGGTDV